MPIAGSHILGDAKHLARCAVASAGSTASCVDESPSRRNASAYSTVLGSNSNSLTASAATVASISASTLSADTALFRRSARSSPATNTPASRRNTTSARRSRTGKIRPSSTTQLCRTTTTPGNGRKATRAAHPNHIPPNVRPPSERPRAAKSPHWENAKGCPQFRAACSGHPRTAHRRGTPHPAGDRYWLRRATAARPGASSGHVRRKERHSDIPRHGFRARKAARSGFCSTVSSAKSSKAPHFPASPSATSTRPGVSSNRSGTRNGLRRSGRIDLRQVERQFTAEPGCHSRMVEHVVNSLGLQSNRAETRPGATRRPTGPGSCASQSSPVMTRYLLNIICPAPQSPCATLWACPR